MPDKKAPAKKASGSQAVNRVGSVVEVKRGTVVVRPDGERVTTGSTYVLDTPGTHRVGDDEITVK